MKAVRGFTVRVVAPVLLAATALADLAQYQSAKRKLDAIGTEKTPPGAQVVLSSNELNSYIQGELPLVVGQGAVTRSFLQLGENSGVMRARINFIKLQQNTGRQPGWLLQRMLEGERDVEVAAHLTSAAGKATVWVDSATVAGLQVPAPMLAFLMQVFIQPQFPNVRIGEPFELRHGVERFEVRPQAVRVFMKP